MSVQSLERLRLLIKDPDQVKDIADGIVEALGGTQDSQDLRAICDILSAAISALARSADAEDAKIEAEGRRVYDSTLKKGNK